MAGPLDGVLVVSLEQAVAAPYCTARLADAGARVIKIERQEGDFARGYDAVVHGESAYFVWLNRGKESIALDLKAADHLALLQRMIAKADVFVQNLAPGAAARLGLGSAALGASFPRLITCDISGYGEDGDWADRKAYDLLIQCESGLTSVTGAPGAPGRVGVSAADICCGMNAHAAVLEALYARERTGSGASVAVSLFDGLAEWLTVPLLHHDYGGKLPGQTGLIHAGIAPYGAYCTRDGRQTVIAVQNEREWSDFCRLVLEAPDLTHDPRFVSNRARCDHRAEMDSLIEAVFDRLTADQLIARLQRAKIGYGAVNTVADLSAHPCLRRIEIGSPTGAVSLPAPAVRVAGTPPRSDLSAPDLDAQGQAIWAEFTQP
jgi:crotonobetainyl-CoA:carnitine CoA-transferase CaiB-like acyl-CoA transferase